MVHLKTCDVALCSFVGDSNRNHGEGFIQADADLPHSGRKKLQETLDELEDDRPLA